MKLHLYYCPGTCSFVPHTLLELLKNNFGIEYEATAVSLKDGQQHTPEYKAVNPRQQVPALLVDGQLLTQVIAITNFLNDSYPQASILPKDAMAKAQALSMLAWINNTVHPTFTRVFRPERFGTEEGQAGVKQKALDKPFKPVEPKTDKTKEPIDKINTLDEEEALEYFTKRKNIDKYTFLKIYTIDKTESK